MKITLLKISLIFIFLLSYCTFETMFLDRFSDVLLEYVSLIQSENADEQINETYLKMQSYMEKKRILLDLVLAKNQQEVISVSMGRIRDYLAEDKAFEARVAAGEIRSYLSDINTPFSTKK